MCFKVKLCYLLLLIHGLNAAVEISSRYHVAWPDFQWQNRTVHFDIDPFIRSNRLMYTTIMDSVAYMNSITCLRWVQRYPWDDGIKHYVTFRFAEDNPYKSRCRAQLGHRGGKQLIDLGLWCITNYNRFLGRDRVRTRSPAIHEMMHTLSFQHEHQRPDRDCYLWVSAEARKEPAWRKNEEVVHYTTDDFPYDHGSVMHYYVAYNVAHPHDPAIRTIGRLDGHLSDLDIWKVETLYCGRPGYCDVRGVLGCERIRLSNENNPNCTKFDANPLPLTQTEDPDFDVWEENNLISS